MNVYDKLKKIKRPTLMVLEHERGYLKCFYRYRIIFPDGSVIYAITLKSKFNGKFNRSCYNVETFLGENPTFKTLDESIDQMKEFDVNPYSGVKISSAKLYTL